MASEQAQPESDSSPEGSNVPAEGPSTAPDAQSSQTEIDVTGTAQEAPTAAETASAETAPSTTAESEQDGVEQVEAGTEIGRAHV